MQRLGPNDRKTFFVTAPVVGRLSGPQVVAILKKEIIIGFTMSAEHSRTYSEDDDDCDDAERMESEHNSGAEDGAWCNNGLGKKSPWQIISESGSCD